MYSNDVFLLFYGRGFMAHTRCFGECLRGYPPQAASCVEYGRVATLDFLYVLSSVISLFSVSMSIEPSCCAI